MEALHLSGYFLHAIIFFFIVGTWAAYRVETFWGHDSQRIVVDEVIGQMIAFFFLATPGFSWTAVLIGFALFRAFDITKPFPIGHLERLPGGLGVIADDVGAGFYALLLLTWLQSAFGI
jgi:phosphatidylglycerophosphatase A